MSNHKRPLTYEIAHDLLNYNPFTGIFTWKKPTMHKSRVGDVAGTPDATGYLRVSIYKIKYLSHRLAWFMHYGEWPSGKLDHRDRDVTNNAIENLRPATNSENIVNRVFKNRKKPRGVQQLRNGFNVRLKFHGVEYNLGRFDTQDEAAHAYNRKAIELHGEFAVLNPIGIDYE